MEVAFSVTERFILFITALFGVISLLCYKIPVRIVLMLVPREFMCVHGGKEALVGDNNKHNIGMKEVAVTFPALVDFFPKHRDLVGRIKLGLDEGM